MGVAVLNQEIPVKKHRKSRRRHREKRRHRNIPPIPERHHPRQVRVVYNHIGLRPVVKPIQQLLHRGLQLGLRGPEEGREVLRPPNFRRDDVGDGGESQILRLGVAGNEAVPFFSENESEESVGAVEGDELAEIHHWVDVASPGIRHRHHVAFRLGVAFHLRNRRSRLSTAEEQKDKNLSEGLLVEKETDRKRYYFILLYIKVSHLVWTKNLRDYYIEMGHWVWV